jgi:antitoxin component of MazEF toxin-antitoxin module
MPKKIRRGARPASQGLMASQSNHGAAGIFSLDDLLSRMKPETFHDDIDFGRPAGKEFW